MPSTSAREADTSSAFLTFLKEAVAARRDKAAQREAESLQAAAQRHPLDDASLYSLIQSLIEERRHDEAVELAAIIAQLAPDHASAHFRLGYTLQLGGRHMEAVAPYRRALAIEPTFPRLRNNLAAALMHTEGSSSEQFSLLESAVREDPSDGDAWTNLTTAYRLHMNLPAALEAGLKAVQSAPHSAQAHNNYALTLREAQRWDEALQEAQTACELAPENPAMRSNLSMVQLVRGDCAHGWPSHEARWDGASELAGQRPVLPKPTWRGESLAGKTLLVWGEQGMGDLLQFCRYLPMLGERVHREGGRLAWNSFPQMGALLVRSLGNHVDEYSAGGGVESLPPFDYEVPLLSLPLIFDTCEDTIPAAMPYLRADATAVESWRKRLAGESRLKVGLTWTGSHGHQRNPFRRVGWERYAAHLRGMRDVAFYSLQPGADADVAAARAAGLHMTDHTAEFTSFDDTAAFISALDLVISVCTSVAHLSGALGQRTWVLLDVNPHWVWLLDRTDSPWYPGTTLYRQRQFNEWEPVLASVANDLAVLASSRPAV